MSGQREHLTYEDSGVNYADMDPFKIECQRAALPTGQNLSRFIAQGLDIREIRASRGESAYRFSIRSSSGVNFEIASVPEGIGSKNKISRQAQELGDKLAIADLARTALGNSFYAGVGWDNTATTFNDLSTCGASPIVYHQFLATGSSGWFADEQRRQDLIKGTVAAVNSSRASWGAGESQTLVDMIDPGDAVLGGAGIGLIFPERNRYPSEANLKPGQRIILFGCEGAQTNGFSLPRRGIVDAIAREKGLPEDRKFEAYTVDIGNGQTFGEAILEPSRIASPIMDRLLIDPVKGDPIPIEYALHISGHGWRKLMRATAEFTYVIDKLPPVPDIFPFIQRWTNMTTSEMYSTYNMGAYYALFVEPEYVERVLETAFVADQPAIDAGVVEPGPKRVVIRPLGDLTYSADELKIR